MSAQTDERVEKIARNAVGLVLLHRESPRGGSFGRKLDESRAERLADKGLSGEELFDLLIEVAKRAFQDAEHQYSMLRGDLLDTFEKAAVRADSLSMTRVVEQLREPGSER